MVLVCHKNFTTRHLRRAALHSAAFFGWAAWMHYMRASVYTQGGTALLAKLGAWQVALPCMAASLLLWLVLFVLARKGIAAPGPTVPAGAGHHHCCAGGGGVGLCAGQCNAKPAPAGKPA